MITCKCCGNFGRANPLLGPLGVGRYKIVTWDDAKEDQVVTEVNRDELYAWLEKQDVPAEERVMIADHLDDMARDEDGSR